MNNLDDFHGLVGETIMYCQCIEHDIKLIYAGMLKGDFDKNYKSVLTLSLGQILEKLKVLDNSDEESYLSDSDYALLDKIRNIRNHWAHKAYTDFIYISNQQKYNEAFSKSFRRLQNDHNRLANLSQNIERVRLDVLKKYGRI